MDAGIWHQVGLELRDVHVQRAVEPQRGCQTGDDLGNKAVQVGVCRALNVEVPAREESSLSACMQHNQSHLTETPISPEPKISMHGPGLLRQMS